MNKIKSSEEIEIKTGEIMARISIVCSLIFIGAVALTNLVMWFSD